MVGPILAYDKSFLECLNPEEAFLLHQLFITNITPVLFLEVLANVKETPRHEGKTPEQVVAQLAGKLPTNSSNVNLHHEYLVNNELMGHSLVPMSYRPIESAPPLEVQAEDGGRGLYYDESTEEKALALWRGGQFSELDKFLADRWKQTQKNLNLNSLARDLQKQLKDVPNFADMHSVRVYTKEKLQLLAETAPESLLKLLASRFLDDESAIAAVLGRWQHWSKEKGYPIHPAQFAPYSYYIYSIEFAYMLGLSKCLIDSGRRSKSHIDLQYLYYLPFCMSFVSNDNTHKKLVPVFKTERHTFTDGMELKNDLATILVRTKEMPIEERKKYPPNYPPLIGDSVVSRIYDFHYPEWREYAQKPNPQLTPEQHEKIIKKLNLSKDAIKKGMPPRPSGIKGEYKFVTKVRRMTAAQMQKEFNLSDDEVAEIIRNQEKETP